MRVTVVTVTYGDRWHLLKQVLEAVLALPSVERVVLVDNGSTGEGVQKAVAMDRQKVQPVLLGENKGSAAGFGAGIRAALNAGSEYLWLLDDDNLPETDALDILTTEYNRLVADTPRDKLALHCMREGREYLRSIAYGGDPLKWYPIDNSFMGFHAVRALKKLFSGGVTLGSELVRDASIPFGMYGGLIFHRSVAEEIGLPLASLFLYADDNEYTLRITRGGGRIFLIPCSRVADIESSWGADDAAKKESAVARQAAASEAQVYYSTRNRAWFSKKYYCGNRLIFAVNKWLYFVRVSLGLLLRGQFQTVGLIRRAVSDGEHERLGRRAEFGR